MTNNFLFGPALRRRIVANLKAFDHRALKETRLRHAAVAIVVVRNPKDDGASVLLTRRASHLERHGGQYALPGGRLDGEETAVEGALRELREELGLKLGAGQVLGRLDDYPTRSGFKITPIVMWAEDPVEIRPDPGEVAKVFHITMIELDSPDIPRLSDAAEGEKKVLSAELPTLGHRIYAPTAAILYQFREVAGRGTPTRVAGYDQPAFAWR